MRAIVYQGTGGVEIISIEERSIRRPEGSEVRVAVKAAGLNRADILQRRGFYPAPPGAPADIPGLEFAGEIESVGSDVRDLRAGDKVMGISSGGSMAELILAHERELIPIPRGMSFEDAAAIPEVFLTAFDALFIQGALRPGMDVLIHAAASGIGTASVQLVKASSGRAFGTLRSESKIEALSGYGFDALIRARDGSFIEEMRTHLSSADLILDTVGAAYLKENIEALSSGGTLVTIGLLGGARGDLNLGQLLAKRASVRGSVLRSRPLEEKALLTQRFIRECLPLFERGVLRASVDRIYEMEGIKEAQAEMEANKNVGKLIVRIAP